MHIAPLPADERERLETLEFLRVLDTEPEPFFDEIAELAQTLTGVKAAMVAMIDGERKWLKSCSGGALGASPREIAFCSHTILQDEVMWVEDSRLDERFWDNPLVTGPKRLNFYAGAPILVDGFRVGTLCLNDETPRAYDAATAATLTRLAAMVARQLSSRRMELMSAGVLAATGDPIVCSDSDHRIIYWNDAAVQLFGYAASEVIGRDLSILTEPSRPVAYQAIWVATVDGSAGAAKGTCEATVRTKDGLALEVEITWASWKDGDRPGLSLAIRDCSERIRAAADLEAAFHRAEAANAAKSEFLTVMSHEIRTPLNGMLGMAQALQGAELTRIQEERLATLRQSGQVLLTLLDDLLDLSRIDAGKLELDRADFDLDDLARSAMQTFEQAAAKKGVGFSLDIDPGAQRVFHGDALRIRQVLCNLASNAVKFTSQGEVRVQVTHDGGALVIKVADTGIGIPEEKFEALFDKFTQADASMTRRYGGSGLGLSICRELAQLMSGSIDVHSVLDEGSVFTAVLPVSPPLAGTQERGATEDLAAPSPGRVRVLAAEDNHINQMVLKALLEQTGVDLTVVENGALAVRAWENESWDLILMDIQMPEMDGASATRAIRAAERRSGRVRTPVIAVTANAMEHQRADYRDAGMDGLVVKPIDATRLLVAMNEALSPNEYEQPRTDVA